MAAEEHRDGLSLGRPHTAEEKEARIMELEPFLQGCFSVFPERIEERRTRLGVLLFLLGAAERYWQLKALDERRFPPYAEGLLRRLGLSAPHAATVVGALRQLSAERSARRALALGADALEDWIRSRDPNVALRVKELVSDWR